MTAEMDPLIADMRDAVRKVQEHDHNRDDIHCLNLTSYMGERMAGVLRRLDEAREEAANWKARHDALAGQILSGELEPMKFLDD